MQILNNNVENLKKVLSTSFPTYAECSEFLYFLLSKAEQDEEGNLVLPDDMVNAPLHIDDKVISTILKIVVEKEPIHIQTTKVEKFCFF